YSFSIRIVISEFLPKRSYFLPKTQTILHYRCIHMKTFSRILRETDYRLNKTFYLASQTAYIIGQLEEMSEEQVDGQRHRSI
ncbi:hypothetical protein ACTNDS_14195, partial [Blautia sp. HCP3S3_C12]